MKRKLLIIFCVISLFIFIPSLAYGYIGPKPSVIVNFERDHRRAKDEEDYEIYKKFVDYRDEDGYYFLQYFRDCTETSEFRWTYYPPQKFK